MRFSTARSVATAMLVPALLLFVLVPGCAKQNEGERCGDEPAASNDDCDDGLICKSKGLLINNGGDVNRCCYADGRITDARCEPSGGGVDTPTTDAGTDADADASDGSN